jgi:hypothetical protein
LEQLSGRRALRRAETGQEVHQPQRRRCAHLAGDRAPVPGRCATDGACCNGQGEAKKSPAKAPLRARAQKGAEERSNKKLGSLP